MKKWFTLVTLLALAVPAVGQKVPDAAAISVTPAGKWNVEFADWKCLLHRDLTVDGKRALFTLSREPLDTGVWLKVALEGGGKRSDGDAVMFIDGRRLPGTLHYNGFKADHYRIREYMIDLQKQPLREIKDRVRLWTKKDGDIDLHLAGFNAAWAALDSCMVDLHRSLGIDPVEYARMATKPEGFVMQFADIPRNTESMNFAILYWLSAAGRVENCRLIEPSGLKQFDESVCRQLEAKARLKPARDSAGNPIRVPQFENVRLRTVVTVSH